MTFPLKLPSPQATTTSISPCIPPHPSLQIPSRHLPSLSSIRPLHLRTLHPRNLPSRQTRSIQPPRWNDFQQWVSCMAGMTIRGIITLRFRVVTRRSWGRCWWLGRGWWRRRGRTWGGRLAREVGLGRRPRLGMGVGRVGIDGSFAFIRGGK